MAKDTKEAKPAPTEELIEKPREPMFSKTGLIVFIGSLIMVAVVVFAAVFMMTGSKATEVTEGVGSGGMAPSGATGLLDKGTLYMEVPEIQSDVAKAGGDRARVQFGLLIRFDGTEAQQQAAKEALAVESKPLVIAAQAAKLMKTYDLSAAQDANFTEQFAFALTRHLNTLLHSTDHKVKNIVVHPFRIIG